MAIAVRRAQPPPEHRIATNLGTAAVGPLQSELDTDPWVLRPTMGRAEVTHFRELATLGSRFRAKLGI